MISNKTSTPKYKINQRVKVRIRPIGNTLNTYRTKKGVVKNIETKTNKVGAKHYYYTVFWDKDGTQLIPQNRITEEN